MNNPWPKRLQRTFFTGLIVLAPLFATVWIVLGLYQYVKERSPFNFEGGTVLTMLAVALIILAVGWLSRTALGSALELVEDWVIRLPGIGLLYKSVRELVNAFSGEERRFKSPVWVYPFKSSKLRLIGFITREDLDHLGAKGHVVVYLPHSYAISGQTVVVPRSLVRPIKTQSRDLFAFVATGGLTGAQAPDKNMRS